MNWEESMLTRNRTLPEGPRRAADRSTAGLALAVLAWLLLLLSAAASALAGGQVDDPAPDFTLLDTTFLEHTLSNYRDNVVVLFMMGYS